MPEGVVIMLDALGFKGIWNSPGEPDRAEEVLAKMKRLRTSATNFQTKEDRSGPVRARCDCISDTIVIGVWPNARPNAPETPLILASASASKLCDEALREPPALAHRGAVAFGCFEMEDGFIIGPAVDEAAASMELAEGAFVWLTPSALTLVKNQAVGSLSCQLFCNKGVRADAPQDPDAAAPRKVAPPTTVGRRERSTMPAASSPRTFAKMLLFDRPSSALRSSRHAVCRRGRACDDPAAEPRDHWDILRAARRSWKLAFPGIPSEARCAVGARPSPGMTATLSASPRLGAGDDTLWRSLDSGVRGACVL